MNEDLENQRSIYASDREWFSVITVAVAGIAKFVDDPPPKADKAMTLATLQRAKAMIGRIVNELGNEDAIATWKHLEQR